jgi:phosphopantetheinyl transferase
MLAQASDRQALFFTLWTVKEAWLKRRLEGVAPRRLAQVECRPDPRGELSAWHAADWNLAVTCAAPRWWTPAPACSGNWRVDDLAATA